MHLFQPGDVLLQQLLVQLVIRQPLEVSHLQEGGVVHSAAVQVIQLFQIVEPGAADADELVENLVLGRLSDGRIGRSTVISVVGTIGDENDESGVGVAVVVELGGQLDGGSVTSSAPAGIPEFGVHVVLVVGHGHRGHLGAAVMEQEDFHLAVVVEPICQRQESGENLLHGTGSIQVIHGNGSVQDEGDAGPVLSQVGLAVLLQIDDMPVQAFRSLSESQLCAALAGGGSGRIHNGLVIGVVVLAFAEKVECHDVVPPLAYIKFIAISCNIITLP